MCVTFVFFFRESCDDVCFSLSAIYIYIFMPVVVEVIIYTHVKLIYIYICFLVVFCRVVKELTVASDMGRAHGYDGVGEILHQLRWVKPWQKFRESPYQWVRYFLHQLYPEDTIYIDQVFTYTSVFSSTTTRTGCVVIVVRNNFPPLSVLLKTLFSEDI